ncbi:MAG: RsbRD N-terminal domain-containing protein [Candidatus Nealsonbacteria bacterium]|nr:RsbRD N-terminal domain-containing protein [Candidatus Nealsonbacteria bacterium]
MAFRRLLQEKKDAIVRRWSDKALASYSGDSAAAFKRQKDPFANPIGHGLRVATQAIFDELLDGPDAKAGPDMEKIGEHLFEVVRVRAVQQFSASEAVGFVFCLKDAVRAELGSAATDGRYLSELAEFDARVDRVALAAFDVFVECRERLLELRINEVKRTVPWAAQKMPRCGSDLDAGPGCPQDDVRREDLR